MSNTSYERLEDVVLDEVFPDVDLALRRGRHIDRDDPSWYAFLNDAQALLEAFYRRFGCELVHKSDGYFYLLPTSDRLGRRHLSQAEMLVGQALTLLYLDPHTVESGGVVSREQLLGQLAGVLGAESLVKIFNPKRNRKDPRIAEETVRVKVAEAVRRLAALGFVDALDETSLKLRPALMRFAEPVRTAAAPDAALTQLIASGELVLADPALDEASVLDVEHDGESEADEESFAPTNEWNDVGEASHLAAPEPDPDEPELPEGPDDSPSEKP